MSWILLGNSVIKWGSSIKSVPVPVSAEVTNDDPDKVVITFDQNLNETSIPATTAFAIAGLTISNVAISTNKVTLTTDANYIYGDSVPAVSYTKPVANQLISVFGGYAVASFSGLAVVNNVEICDEYLAVYNAFIIKPSEADKIIQNRFLAKMVAGGFFAKAEFIDMFAMDSEAHGLFNLHNPATFIPTKYLTPTFQAYKGFKSDQGYEGIYLNYNPYANKINITKDNLCVMVGVGTNVAEDKVDFGGFKSDYTSRTELHSRRANDDVRLFLNSSDVNYLADSTNSIAHYVMSRNSPIQYDYYRNKNKTVLTSDSDELLNYSWGACGITQNGYLDGRSSSREVRYVMCFTYLNEVEVGAVIDIVEEYLSEYGTNLI